MSGGGSTPPSRRRCPTRLPRWRRSELLRQPCVQPSASAGPGVQDRRGPAGGARAFPGIGPGAGAAVRAGRDLRREVPQGQGPVVAHSAGRRLPGDRDRHHRRRLHLDDDSRDTPASRLRASDLCAARHPGGGRDRGNHRRSPGATGIPHRQRGHPLISVTDICKDFGRRSAVKDVSFDCVPGTITGLLGPNGAGKSTILKMLLGLVSPTRGLAKIDGVPYRDLPTPGRTVGVSLDASGLHPGRTLRGTIRLAARIIGVSTARADEVLAQVGLKPELQPFD
ncbi:hypothetical protein DLJ59_07050 [Micromonospora inaquosa]|uniref:ABC transporter domain-containing protein n=1 Tax=Micromonospora inaquosa TaxID=2203716 RepID=A0A3N9WXR3_9ACTN|nr:hypothetical protein DLJ59_07050 [Micromonospora inaquosa]